MTNKPKKFNPYARHKARFYALQALYQWQFSHGNLVDIESHFLLNNDFSKTDVAYFQELLHEIPARLDHIDDLMTPVLDRPFAELNPIELNILRIGIYELCFRLDIPYKVVLNEGIELAKTFGAEDGYKYVNGVLDRVALVTRSQER